MISWAPGLQEARPEAVLGVGRPVQRPSWPPGRLSRRRRGRQDARAEAVVDARRPKTLVLLAVRAKTSVLRRVQAAAGWLLPAKLQTR